ncbi:uncharacterized protein LOC126747494 [Anthonomus grandis grandis]|uniref:uncharacterized protein LOC126747494 n=1 Tax=Anthonomus grandis grandis TaxID=2921223 RepID=UPI002165AD08|nr:uncharacterized protein LOC126747494 [Anthonomus grandis grandis]
MGLKLFLGVFLVVFATVYATEDVVPKAETSVQFVGRMMEEGRTLVHHAMKRFMIILPAIFFKLGIAFTLLVLVAIAAVNNGFIGFMLLVVGLSSVLARFQEAKRPAATPYVTSPYYHHAHILDRKDDVDGSAAPAYQYVGTTSPYSAYAQYYNKINV